jgi:hypothetical protein
MNLYDISKPEGNRAEYWRKRREWWRAHKAKTGTDWAGVLETCLAAHIWLAALRRRAK